MVIEVTSLTKRYQQHTAVDDISFTVDQGGVFAFLGTNGAGKSTTIGCLTTVLPFDAGTIRVAGHDVATDPDAVRNTLGVVFQDSLLDPSLTVRENLRLRGTLSGLPRRRLDERITELSTLIDLDAILRARYGQLSGGQRRRADIARALLHAPQVLFLDEPTAGLDPANRTLIWDTLHTLSSAGGLTVFLTTHYLEETEEASRVCIIDQGRIIADDTPARLRAQHSHSTLTITSSDPDALSALAAPLNRDGNVITIAVRDAAQARSILRDHGDLTLDFEFRHGRMDDVFVALTGGHTPEQAAA